MLLISPEKNGVLAFFLSFIQPKIKSVISKKDLKRAVSKFDSSLTLSTYKQQRGSKYDYILSLSLVVLQII